MRREPTLPNDGLTQQCPICTRPFPRSGRRVFCSATCRQTAWRRRHPIPLPAIPPRTPRQRIVYQCPECDSRYLGEQYCGECGRFCRRIGVGGLCQNCEEPVAINDLLPEYAEPARHPRGPGGRAPSPPNPLTPGAFGTTNYQKEVIHRTKEPGFWAILLAAIGQLRWPPPGAFHDRHWAGPADR